MEHQMTVKREGEFTYDIEWHNTFEGLGKAVEKLSLMSRKACIVTDSTVGPLYLNAVSRQLSPLFEKITSFSFPSGEAQKTLDTVKKLYTHLIEEHYERKDILIALGGGVVGDLTGFTAATYLRGIDFIQIPTTLLSQVDSSVGGKTGVDFDCFKNMVGAFHQPRLVYMSMETLHTLPDVQFSCGMGEVLKSGLIRNLSYYQWTLEHSGELLARKDEVLIRMIQDSCLIKKTVVEHDPTEQGERAVLNLGHTIGHAVEKLKNFEMLHGQCVALGTVAAAYISKERGLIDSEALSEIERGNRMFGLPCRFEGLALEEVLSATRSDKKMEQGKIKFVLLNPLGHAVVDKTVTDDEMMAAMGYIQGE